MLVHLGNQCPEACANIELWIEFFLKNPTLIIVRNESYGRSDNERWDVVDREDKRTLGLISGNNVEYITNQYDGWRYASTYEDQSAYNLPLKFIKLTKENV